MVSVCWLRLEFVPLSIVLGALGSLRLGSLQFILFALRALVDCNGKTIC
jgi:hypothetical protein